MEVFWESIVERYIDAGLNGDNISFSQTATAVSMIFFLYLMKLKQSGLTQRYGLS